jgi:intracellular septation protein
MSEALTLERRSLPSGFTLKLAGKLAGEVGPLLIFFLAYDWWGIFVATAAYAGATLVSLLLTWLTLRRLPLLPLISTALVAVFAGLTIALDNDLFIKLKPTVVNGFYALLIGGGWCLGFSVVRRVLAPTLVLDRAGERALTWRITAYLATLAVANEIVWRSFPLDLWVLFKVFISLGCNLLFVLVHFPFIRRHRVA